MRCFVNAASSRRVINSSVTFRIGFFDGDRYRFFASCCVMVLAPRRNCPSSQFFSSDALISSRSMPS
ncbi:hypothetical protein D3C83_143290 [compost metagenome]